MVRPVGTRRMPGLRSGSAFSAVISSPSRRYSVRYHSASSAESYSPAWRSSRSRVRVASSSAIWAACPVPGS